MSFGPYMEGQSNRVITEPLTELNYVPLSPSKQQIRLAVIHPGCASDPVRCSFVLSSLFEPIPYEAISYAWGSATLTHLIFSPSGLSALPVTASAYSALKAARRPREQRVVWIDGLCINQRDEHEKALQVSIMNHIYGCGENTLVYLGEDDDGGYRTLVQALALLRLPFYNPPWAPVGKLHPIIRALKAVRFNRDVTLDHIAYIAYLAREIEYERQDDFKLLLSFRRSFFRRPWFRRLWIIQEIALSKRVTFLFDGQSVPWGTVMAFYNVLDFWAHQGNHKFYGHPVVSNRSILGTRVFRKFMSDEHDRAPLGFNLGIEAIDLQHRVAAFDLPEEYYRQGHGKLTVKKHLFDLMYEMRHYGCGDSRDRLFAVLSLFDEDIPEELKPDYRSSSTVANVFSAISRYLIQAGHLQILAAAQGLPSSRVDMPSWAVDWNNPPARETLLTARTLGRRVQVGMKEGMNPVHLPSRTFGSQQCLALRGMTLGKCTFVGATCPHDADDETFRRVCSCWVWYNECVYRFPELDLSELVLLDPSHLEEKDCFDGFRIRWMLYQVLPEGTGTTKDPTFKEYCQGRAFAMIGDMEWGWDIEEPWSPNIAMCLVPPSANAGDILCGLIGFEAAVILRPMGNGNYRFVGTSTCWTLSISKAAPFLDWNQLHSHIPPVPLQDFCIY